jgi:hypothetical protein
MNALVVVVLTVGVILVLLVGLLSVRAHLNTRIEFPVLAQPDDDEEPYGDTSAIPGFADESNSVLRRSYQTSTGAQSR